MLFQAFVVLLYGFVVFVGGAFGYITAGSVASLISGGLFGFLLVICGLGILKESVLAFFLALAIAAFLTLFFGYRYTLAFQMFPAGIMSFLSLLVFVMLMTTRKW